VGSLCRSRLGGLLPCVWQGSFWFSDYRVLYFPDIVNPLVSHAILVSNTRYFRLGAPIATAPLIPFLLWRNPSEIEFRSLLSCRPFLALAFFYIHNNSLSSLRPRAFRFELASCYLISHHPHTVPGIDSRVLRSHLRSHHTSRTSATFTVSRPTLPQHPLFCGRSRSVQFNLVSIMPTPLPSSFASAAAGNTQDPSRRGDASTGGEWYALKEKRCPPQSQAPSHPTEPGSVSVCLPCVANQLVATREIQC
jgi:hypothetical protein